MKLRSRRGFTLAEIIVVAILIIIVLAVIIPGSIRPAEASRRRPIQADLKRIADAYQEYYIEYHTEENRTIPSIEELVSLGYLRSLPIPPIGTAPYVPPKEVLASDNAANPDAYPTFPTGNTDNKRVHPQYLAAVAAK